MDLKTAARTRFEAIRPAVIALSHRIHAHPELGFEEEQASMWLAPPACHFRGQDRQARRTA